MSIQLLLEKGAQHLECLWEETVQNCVKLSSFEELSLLTFHFAADFDVDYVHMMC